PLSANPRSHLCQMFRRRTLLDEATAAIDPTNERTVQQALASLVADRTLIVVAHKLGTIRAADQILVVSEGRIAESGSHDALMAAGGHYSSLWNARARSESWRIEGHPSDFAEGQP
ncbi:hypothetical protein, partial [Sphingobium yanoikuyae]